MKAVNSKTKFTTYLPPTLIIRTKVVAAKAGRHISDMIEETLEPLVARLEREQEQPRK